MRNLWRLVIVIIVMLRFTGTALPAITEHLSEPLDVELSDAYRELLKQKLVRSRGDCGSMILMPTGVGEWAVSASAVKRTGKRNSANFNLCLASATSNLYDARGESVTKAATIPVKEICVQIDEAFALTIRKAWRNVLSKDPLPAFHNQEPIILDGYVADFSVTMDDGKVIARRASNAAAPPASEIVNLGYLLRDYCLNTDQRKKKRRNLIDRLNRLADDMTTHKDGNS